MKAKELAAILMLNPDKKVVVRYSQDYQLSEYTRGATSVLVSLPEEAVFGDDDSVIIAADLGEEL